MAYALRVSFLKKAQYHVALAEVVIYLEKGLVLALYVKQGHMNIIIENVEIALMGKLH